MAILLINSTIDGYLITTEDNFIAEPLFESGTKTTFVQSTAPTGWTKITTDDDCALRIVSGDVSSGGSVGFSETLTSKEISGVTMSDTTLSYSQMPSHNHYKYPYTFVPNDGFPNQHARVYGNVWQYGGNSSDYTGGNGSHNHSCSINNLDFSVSYVDTIMAEKD